MNKLMNFDEFYYQSAQAQISEAINEPIECTEIVEHL